MAYGSARYNSYKIKNSGIKMSDVQASRVGLKNNGSALGYLGGNLAAGIGGVGEGIADIFSAAGSLLTGDTDGAKYVFKDNAVGEWHRSMTEEYNPTGVMQFFGDVTHGIGQSSVFLLNAIPGLGQLGTVAFFAGITGQGISNAAEMTGDVGAKEIAYGVLSGATEAALEAVSGGTAKLAKNIGQGFVKNATRTAVRKGLLRQVLSDAAGEFLEEFAGEYTDTFWQRVTQVNPDAEYSFKNAVYSGLVGFVSGGVTAGVGSVASFTGNRIAGKRIIDGGNSQTLVNTATFVADKLAGSGTDFKNTADWVQMLRGQVNAYNKLSADAKVGAKGQTILGEMQTSLMLAEMQATFSGVQKKIETADEGKRAEWAKYINEAIPADKRNKTYTAEDIAKNTDNIAWQLAIIDYVNGIADIDSIVDNEDFVNENLTEAQRSARGTQEATQEAMRETADGQGVAQGTASQGGAVDGNVGQNIAAEANVQGQASQGGAVDGNVGQNIAAEANVQGQRTAQGTANEKNTAGNATAAQEAEGQQGTAKQTENIGDRAERFKRWKEITSYSAKDLNTARKMVKNFDNLSVEDRLRVMRIIKSGEGVDAKIVKGVANLMLYADGLNFRFAEGIGDRGLYIKEERGEVIFVNKDSAFKDVIRNTVAHELTHFLEGKKGYAKLAAYVMKRAKPEAAEKYRKQYTDYYRKQLMDKLTGNSQDGKNWDDLPDSFKNKIEERINSKEMQELIESEVTASLVGSALFNERFLQRYARMNDGGFKRAFNFLKDLCTYIKTKDKETYTEVNKIIALVEVAMLSEQKNAADGAVVRKKSFAGERASTADKMKLATAKEMLENGADSETVRRETGWFKGYDGKWRFEIDDFDSSLIENPKLERHEDDGDVYFTGKISDIFNHKELFKAYPELKDINIVIQKTDFGIEGIYQPNSNYITLSLQQFQRYTKEYYDFLNGGRKSEIEAIERSPEYQEYNKYYDDEVMDEMDPTEWLEAETKARNKFFSSEIGKRYYQLRWGKENYRGDKFEFGWSKEAKAVLLHEIQHAIQKFEGFASGTNTRDKNYDKNAGEIEARDVAKRADLTAEERKNTRPDVDREDVVFSENRGESYVVKKDAKGNEYWEIDSGKDIFKGLNTPEEYRDAAFAFLISNRDNKVVVKDDLGNEIIFIRLSAEEFTNSRESQDLFNNNQTMFEQKMRLIPSLDDILLHSNVNWWSHDHKNHKLFNKNGFENYRGKVRIDNVIFNTIVRVGKANFGNVFYDINLEVDSYLPHASNSASDINEPTSTYNIIPKNNDLSTDSAKKSENNFSKVKKKALAEPGEEAKAKKQKKDSPELNDEGEVKDEFFAAAVARIYQRGAESKTNTADEHKNVANKELEKLKNLHEHLVSVISDSDIRISQLEGKNEAYKEGNKILSELLRDERKKRRDLIIQLEELRSDMRLLGYDFEAEKRKVKRREEQIENQKKTIQEQNREIKKIQHDNAVIAEIEAKEKAALAKRLAKERKEIGKVYSESEIRRELKDMLERGLVSKFFGGQYVPKLSEKKLNMIARYIAIEMNLSGNANGKRTDSLLEMATRDIVARLQFTDEETGEKYVISELVDNETLQLFMDFVSTDIRDIFNNIGTENAYAELIRRFKLLKQKYSDGNEKAREGKAWGREFTKTYQAALKVKALAERNKGAGSDSAQFISKMLGSVVDTAGHMNITKVDMAVKAIADFLEGEAMKEELERSQMSDDDMLTSFSWESYDMIRSLVNQFILLRKDRIGEPMTAEEMKLFGEILRAMKSTIERYNKDYFEGHWINTEDEARASINDMENFFGVEKEHKTKLGAWLGKAIKGFNQLYFYNVLSPETVVEALEGYRANGLLKSLFHSIREAEQQARTMADRMKSPFAEFMDNKENTWVDKDGKKYSFRAKLYKKMINIDGKEITLGEAIYLYMLTKREHAHLGLRENGYITYDDNGGKKVKILVQDPQVVRESIFKELDDADKKFLQMAEEFFNKTAAKIKYDADMKIFGFSNNQDGYYVPIIRDRYARMRGVSDPRMGISSIITVYNKSFTQALVKNNNALEGKSIMRIIDDHADGLADYSEMYLPLKSFDRIYNRRVVLDDGSVTSIREVLNQNVWKGTEKYLAKLFNDVQGQSAADPDVFQGIVGWLRSGWVNSLLGANLKVVVTQTTSLAAATQVIEGKYITAALSIINPAKDVSELGERANKYSKIIFSRHFEKGALKAQGNIDRVTDLGKKTGILIEWMDRRVCLAVFHAAEIRVEEKTGHAIGTEENAKLAAELADKAIFTTQAMNGAAERSALQRSGSEIMKLFSMFTADTVKQLSHLYGNVMKYVAHKQRAATDSSYETLLEGDRKEMLRSVRTLAVVGIMIGLITQGFKYLYGKEDDEEPIKDLLIDVTTSTLNILPIFSEFIDKALFDYDMTINVLDIANNTLESVAGGFKLASKAASGEYVSSREIVRSSLNIIKSGASLFGFPVSPIERTVTGILRRFVPSAVYGYDAMLYSPSYTADLKKAVEGGDERLAEHILMTLYKNEVSGTYTSAELEEVARLYQSGYTSVLPQKVGTTVNDVKLTREQRKKFNSIYSKASSKVTALIASQEFKELTDEQKAKAIKNLYSMYYAKAASEVAGKDWTRAVAYSYLTDNYTALYLAQAYKSGLEAYEGKGGKQVTVKEQFLDYAKNLGLSDADYLVITYANGVRDKTATARLIEYINSLSLDGDVKAKIADRLGFAVKNGVVCEADK